MPGKRNYVSLRMRPIAVIVTCEHGGNTVPKRYRGLFRQAPKVLSTHRAWDPGALVLARQLHRRFGWPLYHCTTTRLLIELNRSLHHPSLFSEFSRALSHEEREQLVDRYYRPYRQNVISKIQELIDRGFRVLHLGIHSFTPKMNGVVRNADLGFLYDPKRSWERQFSRSVGQLMQRLPTGYRVRYNYPYLGTTDGFPTFLRTCFPDELYAGIEVEFNQRFPLSKPKSWQILRRDFCQAIQAVDLKSS